MRRIADEKNVDLVVVDTGDRAEGNDNTTELLASCELWLTDVL